MITCFSYEVNAFVIQESAGVKQQQHQEVFGWEEEGMFAVMYIDINYFLNKR